MWHSFCRCGLLITTLALAACGTPAASTAPAPSAPAATLPAPAQPTAAPAAATVPAGGAVRVLCGTAVDWCEAVMKAAQSQTGLNVTYERLSSGEGLERLRKEKAAPTFDVWYGGPADSYVAAKQDGLLQAYASPTAAQIPPQFKDAGGQWYGIYVGAVGFCSNVDSLKELGVPLPTKWSDLLNPKLKGQVAMSHPATSGTAYTAFWTQVELHQGNIDAAFDYFQAGWDR